MSSLDRLRHGHLDDKCSLHRAIASGSGGHTADFSPSGYILADYSVIFLTRETRSDDAARWLLLKEAFRWGGHGVRTVGPARRCCTAGASACATLHTMVSAGDAVRRAVSESRVGGDVQRRRRAAPKACSGGGSERRQNMWLRAKVEACLRQGQRRTAAEESDSKGVRRRRPVAETCGVGGGGEKRRAAGMACGHMRRRQRPGKGVGKAKN